MSTEKSKSLILNAIRDYYKFDSDAAFARFLGIKPQTLSSWHARNSFDYDIIYSKCKDISPDFILGHKGSIERSPDISSENITVHSSTRSDKNRSSQTVPYYNIFATAGIVELINQSDIHGKHIPIDHIHIPNLPKCDGALPIVGDSMYPLLKSGDIALYKEVHNYENIIWGEMYLVAIVHNGDEFFFAKWLQRSSREAWIKLVSQNTHHQDKEFPLSSVKALALIKATVRINNAF